MSEIRIDQKQDVREVYKGYPASVQLYHVYDIFADEYETMGGSELKRYIEDAEQSQLIILAGMDDSEYQQLQDSFRNHILQKRIRLDEQRRKLKHLAKRTPDGVIYTYCVERVDEDMCVPLKVFRIDEYEEARNYAEDMFESAGTGKVYIQLCEGIYDRGGDMLSDKYFSFVNEVWGDE